MKSGWLQWILGGGLLLWSAGAYPADVEWDDFQRLQSRVIATEESMEVFRQAMQRLEAEIRTLRRENDSLRQELKERDKVETVTAEQLRKVIEQIKEVDRKRVADNQVVVEALGKLEKLLATPPAPPPEPARADPPVALTPKPEPAGRVADQAWMHTVRRGESLALILESYRREYGIKTTMEDVRKANPSIRNINVVQVGQEIAIPAIR
jgi:regulator of replication initiation timing